VASILTKDGKPLSEKVKEIVLFYIERYSSICERSSIILSIIEEIHGYIEKYRQSRKLEYLYSALGLAKIIVKVVSELPLTQGERLYLNDFKDTIEKSEASLRDYPLLGPFIALYITTFMNYFIYMLYDIVEELSSLKDLNKRIVELAISIVDLLKEQAEQGNPISRS
jgi:hypothetical protein